MGENKASFWIARWEPSKERAESSIWTPALPIAIVLEMFLKGI